MKASDNKRVPLNCLVRPDTKQEIKERAINGKSQGDVIDEAMSALYRETGTAYDPRPERAKKRKAATPPAFKGPLLKPKDRK